MVATLLAGSSRGVPDGPTPPTLRATTSWPRSTTDSPLRSSTTSTRKDPRAADRGGVLSPSDWDSLGERRTGRHTSIGTPRTATVGATASAEG